MTEPTHPAVVAWLGWDGTPRAATSSRDGWRYAPVPPVSWELLLRLIAADNGTSTLRLIELAQGGQP